MAETDKQELERKAKAALADVIDLLDDDSVCDTVKLRASKVVIDQALQAL